MGTRQPGPLGANQDLHELQHGTLVRRPSIPGPTDTSTTARVKQTTVAPPAHEARKSRSALALPILKQGAQGLHVQKLQRQLNVRLTPSPRLAVDGIFGPLTHRATVTYQKAVSIEPDGIVGKQTWFYLLKGDKASNDAPVVRSSPAPAPAPSQPSVPVKPGVWEWPLEDKFAEALRRTAPKLDDSIRDEFVALLTPTTLAFVAGTLVVWAASHAFGVGQVVDIALLLAGLVFLGMAVFDVAGDLSDFLVITSTADSEEDLENASSHLSHAVAVIGVAAFMALLARVAAKGRVQRTRRDASSNTKHQELKNRDKQSSRATPNQSEAKPPHAPRQISKNELADWYRKQDERFKNPRHLEDHLEGTDFSKSVTLRELPKDTEVIQYVRENGKPGMYFARPGTPMQELGIGGKRELQRFIVKEPIQVVESTSKTIAAGKAPGVGGTGGAQQLIFPSGWQNSVVRLP